MTERADKSAERRQLELLGEHIRKLRIARRYSQVGFAVRAEFAGAYYSAIERGKLNFSIINLIKIARALGTEVGELFPAISMLVEVEPEDISEQGQAGIAEHQAVSYEVAEQPGKEKEELVTLLSAGAAARLLNVNRRTVERWAQQGMLNPAARIEDQQGKLYSVFTRTDVEQLVQERHRR